MTPWVAHPNVVRLRGFDYLFAFFREQMIGIKVSDDVFTASFGRKKSWIFGRSFGSYALCVMGHGALTLVVPTIV